MSFLSDLLAKKNNLKSTETTVTYADGRRHVENSVTGEISKTDCARFGFVVDTKPDLVPACIFVKKLYLGSQDAVNDRILIDNCITHILSVGIETPPFNVPHKIVIKFISCLDLPESKLNDVIAEANVFIANALKNDKNTILVHCNAGVSRSSSIVIGYLMLCCDYTFEDAFGLVKSKRQCIQPNAGFLMQLKMLKK